MYYLEIYKAKLLRRDNLRSIEWATWLKRKELSSIISVLELTLNLFVSAVGGASGGSRKFYLATINKPRAKFDVEQSD